MSDDHPPVTIANSEVRTLRSQHVDQRFQLNVTLPAGYHGGDARYPAVYLLDGNWTTGLVTETARTLQLGGEFPPAIIVGVGYVLGEKGPAEVMSLRTRDYTPTPDSGATGENAERMRQMLGDVRPGGAAAFLRFLVDELKPFIASQYRVDDSAGTLAGDSLGGLFALYTMFHAPEAFDRYLVGSPSIWWDGRVTLQYEEAYAATHTGLAARVFMSVGALEEPEPGAPGDELMRHARMVSNMREMAARLRSHAYPGLELTTHVFEGETHTSVIPATMSRGLRVLFADSAPTSTAAPVAEEVPA